MCMRPLPSIRLGLFGEGPGTDSDLMQTEDFTEAPFTYMYFTQTHNHMNTLLEPLPRTWKRPGGQGGTQKLKPPGFPENPLPASSSSPASGSQ